MYPCCRNTALPAGQCHHCSSLVEQTYDGGYVADGRIYDACYSPTYGTWPLTASRLKAMHWCMHSMGFQALICAGTGNEMLS